MSLRIRRAELSDADPLTAVFLAVRRIAMPWLRVVHTDAETRWWMRTMVLPTNTVWVAEEAGQPLGFAARCASVLEHLYVHPDVWGRRLGTRLLDTVRAEPTTMLSLTAFQRNFRARRFYEAHGFTLVALGMGTTNEEGEPDAYYEWRRRDAPMAGH